MILIASAALRHRQQTSYKSRITKRNLNLGLELLEQRRLLAGNSFENFAPASLAFAPDSSSATPAALASPQASSGANPAATQPSTSDAQTAQLQQVFFTVSLLVSGAQVPILPYERTVVPATVPNQPQAFSAPSTVSEILGLSIPGLGARPVLLGSSGGGDSTLSSRISGDPLNSVNPQDQTWPSFGNREAEGPSSEVPTQEMIDQVMGLGEMDDLMRNDVVPPGGSAAPGITPGSAEPGAAGTDQLEDDFNFDGGGADDATLERDASPADTGSDQGALFEGTSESHRIAVEPISLDPQATDTALPTRDDWSIEGKVVLSTALVSLLANRQRDYARDDRMGRYELRPKA
ncbi:MAG TPA: hypothetical protein VGH74_11430 [Planctomycetaceae bacterium]